MNKKIVETLCDFAAKHPDVEIEYTSEPGSVKPKKHDWGLTIGLIFFLVMAAAEYIRTAWM